MDNVLDALSRAFRDLFKFRVLWIVIWPMLAAVLMWLILGVAFRNIFSGWIAIVCSSSVRVAPAFIHFGLARLAYLRQVA